MNVSGAIAAMKAFKEAATGDVVPVDEISRRSRICEACPMKQRATGAATRASQTLGLIANKNRVPVSVKNFKCGVCGCALLLLLPSKTLHTDTEEQRKLRPKGCWYPGLAES